MTNKIDELIATSEIGDEAKQFLKGHLGTVLIGFARQDAESALKELAEVNPTDAEKIRSLQNKARFGYLFEEWLNDLVIDGDNADSELRQIKQEM